MPANIPFVKYNLFIDALVAAGINLKTTTYRVALTNRAPDHVNDAAFSGTTAPPPANANGYVTGGNTLTNTTAAVVGGVFTLTADDSVFTATAGGIGPFQFVVCYTGTGNILVGSYDYGSPQTLNQGDTFTVDYSTEVFHIS